MVNEKQLDVLKELINIGAGKGAGILNSMIDTHVHLEVPLIKIFDFRNVESELSFLESESLAAVSLDFHGIFSGSSELIFPSSSGSKLVNVLTEEFETDPDLDALRAGTLTEIGNVVLNSIIGTISNMLELHFRYTVPLFVEGKLNKLSSHEKISEKSTTVLARTKFLLKEYDITGEILIFFETDSFETLLKRIDKFIEQTINL